MKHLIQCCVFLLLAITPLQAQPAVEVGDVQNFSQAEVVLLGEVLASKTSLEFGRSVTDYRVAVDGVVKGELSYSPVVIRAYGSEHLNLEERVLLFLGSQESDGAFHILQVNHLSEEGQKVGRAAAESPDKMCGPIANGTALDATGDAVANNLVSPSPDLVAASASSNGTNVAFTVRYDPATFDPATTRFRFYVDIDENPATGFPGVLGNDSNLFGTEFIIATDGNGTQIRKHDPTSPPGGSQFDIIGSASVTVLSDGFRTAIPLDLFDNDNVFAFKVFADVHVGGTFTNETDYVPNVGLAPGRTRPTGNAVAAPSNLRANAISQGQVNLDWNDNSNNEAQFEVERRTGNGAFQRIAVVAQNVSFFRDQTVSSETNYGYRVRAVSDGCPSNYSAVANATTPSAGELRPVDLAVEALSSSEIRLNWTDRAASEDGYEVQAQAEGGDFTVAQTLPADSESTTVDGLMEGTNYTFRVRATGGLGNSPFSNQATARTFFANPEPCVPGPNTLCLQEGRFKVEIDWRDFEDNEGTASDAGLTSPDSGLLYFFTPANWEMLVKVIDGCGFNGHFWVFAAATTNVEYTLKVTDSVSGFMEIYHNDLGVSSPAIADINAFATCGGDGLSTSEPAVSEAPALGVGALPTVTSSKAAGVTKVGTGCVPSDTNLCLNDERFHVEIEWKDFEGNTGVGHVDPLQSGDSGLFWFFNEDNVEVLVKVIDGCGFNGHHWVFAAATTNVEYTLRVIETESGDMQEYPNPLGNAAAATTDVTAFANCP